MNKVKFKGVFTALLTPYENGKLNEKSLKKLIDFNIKCGVNGFYVGGSTGEGAILSTEERKELFNTVGELNAGRVTLIAHVGSPSTDTAVELAEAAYSAGFDAVSAVAPYYYAHNYDAIKSYYSEIANATPLPMIIYNFPLAGSFNLTPQKAADLLANKKIIGIKHTSQDLFALERLKSLDNPPIVFNGYDEMFAGGLIMGADGGIGSTYNFMPHKIVSIYRAFKDKDVDKVMKLQHEANDIIQKIIDASGKCGIMNAEKAILTAMGIPMGQCKKPFLPIEKEDEYKMKEIAGGLISEIGGSL